MIQMTISHVYKKVSEVMTVLENINIYEISSRTQRILNQQKINKVYIMLDDFKAEIEREIIKNKQKKSGGTNE